jgi:hypothetical protein
MISGLGWQEFNLPVPDQFLRGAWKKQILASVL